MILLHDVTRRASEVNLYMNCLMRAKKSSGAPGVKIAILIFWNGDFRSGLPKRFSFGYGFELLFFHFADIDECSARTHKCQQTCRNTVGSYTCSCGSGYQLHSTTQCRGEFVFANLFSSVKPNVWNVVNKDGSLAQLSGLLASAFLLGSSVGRRAEHFM